MKTEYTIYYRFFRVLLALLLLVFLFAKIATAQDYVHTFDFNNLAEGSYNQSEIKEALNVSFCNGADEGRVYISSAADHGKVLDVKYPKGGVKTESSGMHTKVSFQDGKDHEELYMSYWIYFPSNFEFRAGGKLPGLAYQTSNRNMSLRLMWRYDGLIEYYVHYNTKPTREDFRASINWSLMDPVEEPDGQPQPDQVKFKKGAWNHVELYYKLNTPGKSDGIMRGWLDGQLAINIIDQGDYRQADEGDIKLNTIYLSTFFGGTDETFQPQKDEYAYFDDIIVSTSRIGYPGSEGEGTMNLKPTVSISSPDNNTTLSMDSSVVIKAVASDIDGAVAKVQFFVNGINSGTDYTAPYECIYSATSTGNHIITAKATDDDGSETTSAAVAIAVNNESSTCNFGTPLNSALMSYDDVSFVNMHVLGTGGPAFTNLSKLRINWISGSNTLNRFAINTTDGFPEYYNDLRSSMTYDFGGGNPYMTISGSGFAGLDGSYWVTNDGDNFVMVSKTEGFTIYFSNSAIAPECSAIASLKSASGIQSDDVPAVSIYPNPIGQGNLTISGLSETNVKVWIADMLGKTLCVSKLSENAQVDVSKLKAGTYILTLKGKNTHTTKLFNKL